MRDHFRKGRDPDVLKFDKATVTSENMISCRPGWPNKAERVKQDIEDLKL